MNAPVHLPVLPHDAITAPGDRVRCERFSSVLSASACAARSLAVDSFGNQIRGGQKTNRDAADPGSRTRPRGVARYATCATCPIGAVARDRLAITREPGRVAVMRLPNIDSDLAITPRSTAPLSAADAATLGAIGWTMDPVGSSWRDAHGQRYTLDAARTIAQRERSTISTELRVAASGSTTACATAGCPGKVGGAHARTAPVLRDRCPRCRVRAGVALGRRTTTLATLGAWLDGVSTRRATHAAGVSGGRS